MHYVLEIVMPQVDDVEKAVSQIMAPFDENGDSEDISHPFWDFYVIGGRWAGHKLEAGLDKEKIESFYNEMKERNVTVSSMQCGKQEIAPASQIPMVDELWSDYFPEFKGRACPLFKHANNQYENDCLYGDVLRIKDMSKDVTCSRLIVAGLDYQDKNYEAITMLETSIWNGVTNQDTTWDGAVISGLSVHNEKMKNYTDEYREKYTPDDDWIMVTVDYHS